MADYLPKDEPSLAIWLGNYQAKMTTYGATLGLAPAEMADLSTACTNLSNLIHNVESAKNTLKNLVKTKNTAMEKNIAVIRRANNKMKTNDAFTDAIGKDMGIKGSSQDVDREAAKPKLSGEAFSGYVRLKFSKNGLDGVNIYSRLKEQGNWNFLARDTNSPYDDHKTLANGTPEIREYMCIGVM
jgi:hypothetical protein